MQDTLALTSSTAMPCLLQLPPVEFTAYNSVVQGSLHDVAHFIQLPAMRGTGIWDCMQ